MALMKKDEFILFPVIIFLILPGHPAQDIESTTVVGATMTAPITVDSSVKIIRKTFTPLDVTSAMVPTEPPLMTSPASTISTTAASTPEKTTTVPTEKIDKTNWEATTTHVFIPVSSIDAKSTTILLPVSKVSTTFSVKITTEVSHIATEGPALDTTTPLEPTTLQDVLPTVVSLLPNTYQKLLTNDLTAWSFQTTTPSTEGSPTLLTESTTPIVMRMHTGRFSNPSTTDTSRSSLDSVLIEDPLKPSLLWSIIVTTLVGVIVVAGVMCLYLFVNLKRPKRTKHFGSNLRNGHGSKRKKMAEEDAWAGPVNLGNGEGEECDGVEEGGTWRTITRRPTGQRWFSARLSLMRLTEGGEGLIVG
ncbi:zonadhesin-like isoform X2 [Hypomesus transpacificus]|uniref:zonadhesin-like isoform X2 n=1 Tax=Hypomesus transpacificus TaxID=137520 RepID=UPI001F0719BF|nr:zonadhesin-like isoform X2 [Hypomesus transpacificus]